MQCFLAPWLFYNLTPRLSGYLTPWLFNFDFLTPCLFDTLTPGLCDFLTLRLLDSLTPSLPIQGTKPPFDNTSLTLQQSTLRFTWASCSINSDDIWKYHIFIFLYHTIRSITTTEYFMDDCIRKMYSPNSEESSWYIFTILDHFSSEYIFGLSWFAQHIFTYNLSQFDLCFLIAFFTFLINFLQNDFLSTVLIRVFIVLIDLIIQNQRNNCW